ncbi:hypothetical protein SASPL_115256 [Salvia splendens]|uniref:NAC domain-containing protein n=1 Tax=Salvia splendens TaxID=180675 RepID=A0A8X8Y250_SALSN|nr:hypothetical protein SASPL_115256 [Salvia splendens]
MCDNLDIRIEQGFELNPTGEKLINGYLIPWVMGQNPIWKGVIEKAIYGDSSPWEIFSNIESRWHSKMEEKGAIKYTIFVFTTLLKAQNSKRVCRRAGRGTQARVGHWTMHEYSLSEESVKMSGRANAANLVVCKITKTVKKKDKSVHNTNQSPAAIGYDDHHDAMAAQQESNGESCNLVRFAPKKMKHLFS